MQAKAEGLEAAKQAHDAAVTPLQQEVERLQVRMALDCGPSLGPGCGPGRAAGTEWKACGREEGTARHGIFSSQHELMQLDRWCEA